jgi:hypothetical protein
MDLLVLSYGGTAVSLILWPFVSRRWASALQFFTAAAYLWLLLESTTVPGAGIELLLLPTRFVVCLATGFLLWAGAEVWGTVGLSLLVVNVGLEVMLASISAGSVVMVLGLAWVLLWSIWRVRHPADGRRPGRVRQ